MHRLMTALGMPQHRFGSIHVVGTNGKSSVTRMTAALLEAHGLRTGCCLSPHVSRWSERILVGGEEIGERPFAQAVQRAAEAAAVVNRGLGEGEAVTQFEVATAATFLALAAARVNCAVVEAGLGGRLDATNVIPSRVTVLTSVGRDHTEWLGETEEEIASEKLAVLRDQSTLVVGELSPAVDRLATETARRRGARLLRAPVDPGPDLRLRAPGAFQRRNFALAITAAEAYAGGLDRDRVRTVAAEVVVPGRLELVADAPPCYLDAAHNADGAVALAEALGALDGKRPLVACLGILTGKDASAIVAALAPRLAMAVCTEVPAAPQRSSGGGSWLAEELVRICAEVGLEARAEPDPPRALAQARASAAEAGGVALAAGSHYLLGVAREVWSAESG
jgi:dihydrofolate synthase/folylpolyglutamate synthase